jgi:hypothetical protein
VSSDNNAPGGNFLKLFTPLEADLPHSSPFQIAGIIISIVNKYKTKNAFKALPISNKGLLFSTYASPGHETFNFM